MKGTHRQKLGVDPTLTKVSDGSDEVQRALVGKEEPEGSDQEGPPRQAEPNTRLISVQRQRRLRADGNAMNVSRDSCGRKMFDVVTLMDDYRIGQSKVARDVLDRHRSLVGVEV